LSIDLQTNPVEISTVDALARSRRFLLARAHQLLTAGEPASTAEPAPLLSALAGVLLSSLEELKVAEEELREASNRIDALRTDGDKLTRHYRELFLQLPMPAIVTDIYGTILEANRSAAALFRRDAPWLERKSFATLLDASHRDEFRRQLARVTEVDDTVTRWRVVLHRTGDLPVTVSASAKRVASIGPTGAGALLWLFDPLSTAD
jgi:PAS domain S-box-containing protein